MLQVLLFNWKGLQGLLWTTESRKICMNKNEDAMKPRFLYQRGYRSLEMIDWWLKNAPAALIIGRQAGRQGAKRRRVPVAAFSVMPLIIDTIVCLFPPPSSLLPPGSNYIL